MILNDLQFVPQGLKIFDIVIAWEDLVFFGIFIVVFFVVLIQWRKQIQKQKALMEQQALKRGGTVGGFKLGFPVLHLFHEGSDLLVRVSPAGKNSPPTTTMIYKFPAGQQSEILISGKMELSRFLKAIGKKEIRMNDAAFDQRFCVQAKDEMFVYNFLVPDVRQKLLVIEAQKPTLEIDKNKFTLSISKMLETEGEYDRFLETGLALLQKAQEMG